MWPKYWMCIEVTFLFSDLLKSKKIDLSKTLVRSKIFRLGREELNTWLKFAPSLLAAFNNTNWEKIVYFIIIFNIKYIYVSKFMYASHLSLGFCERRYVIFMLCKLTLSCYFATLKIILLAFPILALNFCTQCNVCGFCISSIANSICQFRTMLNSCGLKN